MNNKVIEEIPELPEKIIEAVNNDSLAIFIGAGVSRLAFEKKCIGWNELGNKLIDLCFERDFINFKEKESLSERYGPKKAISICYNILNKQESLDLFYNEMRKALNDFAMPCTSKIYDYIKAIPGVYITTNADRCFQDINYFRNDDVISETNKMNEDEITFNRLFKIHGCISNTSTLVFRQKEYFDRYKIRTFIKFLTKLFATKTFLFVGYELNEIELLEYIFQKTGIASNELRHYLLQPMFSGDSILSFEESYYNDMGIDMIPFLKDKNGYRQLENVLENWSNRIRMLSKYNVNTFDKIESLLSKYNEQNRIQLFNCIHSDDTMSNHMYEVLKMHKEPQIWFEALYEDGQFNPEYIPKPEYIDHKKERYTIKSWKVMSFLEHLSNNIINVKHKSVLDKFVGVVDRIVEYLQLQDNFDRNHLVEYQLVKILFNLPSERFKNSYINFIGNAIRNNTGADYNIQSHIVSKGLQYLIDNDKQSELCLAIDICFSFEIKANDFDFISPLFRDYYLREIIEEHDSDVFRVGGVGVLQCILGKVDEILNLSKNYFAYRTLYEVEWDATGGYRELLLYFMKKCIEFLDAKDIYSIVNSQIEKVGNFYLSVVLYTVGNKYDNLKDLFWRLPFNVFDYKYFDVFDDLYYLLSTNAAKFNDNEINKLISKIEGADYGIKGLDNTKEEIAFSKKQWLHFLLESKNSNLIAKYNEYDSVNDRHVFPPTPNEVVIAEGYAPRSPIGLDELKRKNIIELIDYLNGYDMLTQEDIINDSKDGLKNVFEQYVKSDVQYFLRNTDKVIRLVWEYKQILFKAINSNANEMQVSDWELCFGLISNLVSQEIFDEDDLGNTNYINSSLRLMCNLIDSYMEMNDKQNEDHNLSIIIESILLLMLDKVNGTESQERNSISYFINSAKGDILTSIINYSLYIAKDHQGESVRWPRSIKEQFTQRLRLSKDNSVEFIICLGRFLNYIYYFDSEWVKENAKMIFSNDNFKTVIVSYLETIHSIDREVYLFLKENGYIKKAFELSYERDYPFEKLIQLICVAYLHDIEDGTEEDDLVIYILELDTVKVLNVLAGYWPSLSGNNNDSNNYLSKTKWLWGKLFDVLIINKNNTEYQPAIRKLSNWLRVIGVVDKDIIHYLNLSAEFDQWDGNDWVKRMELYYYKQPKYVAEIFLILQKYGKYPTIFKDVITKMVEHFYNANLKEMADTICNQYFSRNLYFLREIYRKYNNH